MKTVILMCDGLGSRWIDNKNKYKHLITFDEIPLVFRTIYQLQNYPCNIILIAPDDFRMYEYYPENIIHTTLGYREHEPRTLLGGILRTKDFWTEDTSILLGDVVFSKHAIDLLFAVDFPSWMMGRIGENKVTGKTASELFSFSFNSDFETISDQLKETPGKLWNYYYKYFPPLIELEDYTDDFDNPQAYEQFYTPMLYAVRRDE